MNGKFLSLGLALMALTACGSVDTATRNAPGADPGLVAATRSNVAQEYAIRTLDVEVPETLKVSEENVFLPLADIVWRGDAFGDRHEQVKAIFQTAFQQAHPTEGRPVDAKVEVLRFHGLTEKARYVTGGVYAMHFRLTLTDPATGAIVDRRIVNINLPQAGGYVAMLNDHNGNTEKKIVTAALVKRIRHELGQPDVAPPLAQTAAVATATAG